MTEVGKQLASNLQASSGKLRVTIGNLKGGTGRSTTAVLLALALARTDPGTRVYLVDADSANATAWDWSEDAGEAWPSAVTVMRAHSAHLARRVRDDVPDAAHLVIDTGPHDAGILRQALTVTDHLLVPLAPTGNEVTRLTPTLEAAAEVGAIRELRLSILLNRVVPNTRSRVDVRTAITEHLGLRVMSAEVSRRELYAGAHGTVPADLGAYPEVLAELLAPEPTTGEDTP